MMVVPSGSAPSSKASQKTVYRRTKAISAFRAVLTADDCASQLQREVKTLGKAERQELLKGAGITVDIPAEVALAMKAELSLPWARLRSVRR
jgi:hypothetical protein